MSLFKDAAKRVSRTWAAKTRDLGPQPPPAEETGRRKSGGSKGSGSAGSADHAAGSTAAGSGEGAGTSGHASAGRPITTLPPKSQRVSVLRYSPPSGNEF